MTKKNKIAAVAASAALVAVGGGAAYAYWSTTGSGTGTGATSAGASNLAIAQTSTISNMYPGDSAQTVTATVTNTGTETYKVQALKAYVTTDKQGCTGADYLLNTAAAPSTDTAAVDLGLTAASLAHNGTTTKTFTMQFNNTTSNQDACKGAAVTIHYLAS
jgi:hypothetical protein